MINSRKNPAVTVDMIIFTVIDNDLKVVLIQRKNPPFQDKWAIPGGFIEYDEDIYDAAKRELKEETGLENIYLEQLKTFGKPNRDPRGRTISVVYFALVNSSKLNIRAQSDAKDAQLFSLKNLPELAFDHKFILDSALQTLRMELENTSIASGLLPENFTINQLLKLYEIIFGINIDDGRFKCEILRMDFIEKTGSSTYSFKKDIGFSSRFH